MSKPRVSLVTVEAGTHAKLLFEWRSNPDIAQFMYSQTPLQWESHLAWVKRLSNDPHRSDFVITLDEIPVGSAYLTAINREHRRCDFGMYVADAKARVQGVGAAAEFLILDQAFAEQRMHKVSCEVFATNTAPVSMHKRFGFQNEGTLRDHVWDSDRWIDVFRMSLLEDEWRDSRSRMVTLLARLIQTD